MANDKVVISDNAMINNSTAHVMLTAYLQEYNDERYNPYASNVTVAGNIYGSGGAAPDLPGGELLAAAAGGAIPPVLTDGRQKDFALHDDVNVMSLGLTELGQPMSDAQPQMLDAASSGDLASLARVELPAEMEARLQ